MTYRERIDRYLERHPGATLSEARGHGRTPEHPSAGKGQERYAEYHERREAAEAHLNTLKAEKFGNEPAYNAESAAFSTSKMSMSKLDAVAGYDSLDDFADDMGGWDEIDEDYGYYH